MGSVFRATYWAPNADGVKVKCQSPNWSIQYRDEAGRVIRKTIGPHKRLAERALIKAEQNIRELKLGLTTRDINDIPLEPLVDEYLRDRQRRVCRSHYENLKHRLHAVIDGVNASVVIQLTPDAVEIYLDTLASNGAAPRTVNTYLTAIKSFLNWAVMNRKIAYNPLDAVSMRPEHEKRKKRRPLTDDEIARLLACAEAGPLRRCRSRYQGGPIPRSVQNDCEAMGRRNALIYRIMLFTGLRRNEVKQLRWSDVDLDNGVIHCRPEWTKNRKAAVLPLHASLIDILKATQRVSEYVVRLPHKLLRAFKDDLRAAGIALIDESGRSVDMHALRHTFAQRLCASGVDPKTMQGLMRHSSPALTLKVYVHLDQARMSAAMMNLPSIASVR